MTDSLHSLFHSYGLCKHWLRYFSYNRQVPLCPILQVALNVGLVENTANKGLSKPRHIADPLSKRVRAGLAAFQDWGPENRHFCSSQSTSLLCVYKTVHTSFSVSEYATKNWRLNKWEKIKAKIQCDNLKGKRTLHSKYSTGLRRF